MKSYTVNSVREAWSKANEIFPTDYEHDTDCTRRAGYDIYWSTRPGCTAWISDLGNRLEVNLPNGESVNIWIEEPEKENPVEIFVNDALNGIELKFSRKPDEQTREALKSSGWRWHRKRCVWYTKNNPGNMEMAQRIAAAVTK